MDDLKRGRTLHLALVTLVILACAWLLWELRDVVKLLASITSYVLAPFLISVIIAYLLHPLVQLLHRRGVPRGASIVIIYIVFFLFVTVLLLNMIPLFIDQLRELSEKLPALIKQAEKWMNNFHQNKRYLPLAVRNAIDSNLTTLESKTTTSISHILEQAGVAVEGMAGAFVVPFLVFYMLKDVKGIERAVIAFFPKGNRSEIMRLIRSVDEALGNYIRGQLLVAFLVGVLAYVGYLIIAMPYGFLLALIVAVTNIIPYVGPFIGAAPAILLAFTVSPMMALKVLIVNLVIQQLEGNVISPLLIGRSLKLHPMLIIFALLLGGEMFGMVGLILCIPVVAVGKVLLQHLVLHYMRR